MTQNAPEIHATQARQARRGNRVIVVLAASLAILVVAFIALYAVNAPGLSGRGGQTRAPAQIAQTTNTPPDTATESPATAPQGSVAAQSMGSGRRQSSGG